MSDSEQADRDRAIAILRSMLEQSISAQGMGLLNALFQSIDVAAFSPCRVIAARPGHDGTRIGGLVFYLAAPMSDADLQRFVDFAHGFIQDVGPGQGLAMPIRTHIDTLHLKKEPEAE